MRFSDAASGLIPPPVLAIPATPQTKVQVVLASLSQARRTGVFIDFTSPEVRRNGLEEERLLKTERKGRPVEIPWALEGV